MSTPAASTNKTLYDNPHRRFNPLTGEWILVSPHRSERPWRGQTENANPAPALAYDPTCYLCPGNERAGGARNPNYTSTFVFTNDFAALKPDVAPARKDDSDSDSDSGRGLLLSESERGICKVICYSPRHDLTLARMKVDEILAVVDLWTREFAEIGSSPDINYVQIFENRGEMMGCSNPHPHGQIWANQTIPNEPRKEQESQSGYSAKYGSCLLCDYLQLEVGSQTRVVLANDHFVALVPFWAVWPFEILLVSKAPRPRSARSRSRCARQPRRNTQSPHHPLRQSLRNLIPLLHGIPSGAHRRQRSSRMASARPFLSAAAAFRDHPQIHGGIRNARRTAARHHSRSSRGHPPKSLRNSLR